MSDRLRVDLEAHLKAAASSRQRTEDGLDASTSGLLFLSAHRIVSDLFLARQSLFELRDFEQTLSANSEMGKSLKHFLSSRALQTEVLSRSRERSGH